MVDTNLNIKMTSKRYYLMRQVERNIEERIKITQIVFRHSICAFQMQVSLCFEGLV